MQVYVDDKLISELKKLMCLAKQDDGGYAEDGLLKVAEMFFKKLNLMINFNNRYKLSSFEIIVLALSIVVKSKKIRSEILNLAPGTLDRYEDRIKSKLACDSKLMAVSLVISANIITLPI